MKTFKDLEFKEHNDLRGIVSRITFDNGYGASVVRHEFSYGGDKGLYELAVLNKAGDLTYNTPVTNDVIGHLTEDEVTTTLFEIQKLPSYIENL